MDYKEWKVWEKTKGNHDINSEKVLKEGGCNDQEGALMTQTKRKKKGKFIRCFRSRPVSWTAFTSVFMSPIVKPLRAQAISVKTVLS